MQWFERDGSVKIDLSKLDVVIEAAEATNMKLILALTNNWADYGGMDVYTVNLGGRYHDDVSETVPLETPGLIGDSSIVYLPLKQPSRTTSRPSSTAIRTLPQSWPGKSPMSPAAAPTAFATSLADPIVHPKQSRLG
jgi:hypothetical protein